MSGNWDEMEDEERLTRALERRPAAAIPKNFAARVAAAVPEREAARSPAGAGDVGFRVAWVCFGLLVLGTLALAPGAEAGGLGRICLEASLEAELVMLAVWFGVRMRRQI